VFYKGTINVASGGFANNYTGASGGDCFTIPAYGKNLYFEPNVATGQFQFFAATGISGRAVPTNAAFWAVADSVVGPFPIPRMDNLVTIAIYSGAGPCKVKVYVDPSS
jgi:hypothetical protein